MSVPVKFIPDPAYVAAWVIHRDLAREPMYREDFRDVTLTPDGRVEYVSVPSGRRMEIVVRPVERSESDGCVPDRVVPPDEVSRP